MKLSSDIIAFDSEDSIKLRLFWRFLIQKVFQKTQVVLMICEGYFGVFKSANITNLSLYRFPISNSEN